MLYITTVAAIFALFMHFIASFALQSQTFNKQTDTRIVSSGASMVTTKVEFGFECAIMCTNDNSCCSSSFDKYLKQCQLSCLCNPTVEHHNGSFTFIKTLKSEKKSLDDKVAIVTGASSGIGEAIGITLAKAGAKVALAARRGNKLEDVKRTIEEFGGVCIQVKTDVAVRSDVKDLVRRTASELGPVDIMINNAGAWYYTLVKNLHEDKWDQMIDVNCKGLTNDGAVIDEMVKRKSGHIVNISSDSVISWSSSVYRKQVLHGGFSQTLRQEVFKQGIRVTVVQPGSVNVPDMADKHIDQEVKMFEETESGKSLEPEDIPNAVLYAVSQPDYVGVNEILVQPRDMPF